MSSRPPASEPLYQRPTWWERVSPYATTTSKDIAINTLALMLNFTRSRRSLQLPRREQRRRILRAWADLGRRFLVTLKPWQLPAQVHHAGSCPEAESQPFTSELPNAPTRVWYVITGAEFDQDYSPQYRRYGTRHRQLIRSYQLLLASCADADLHVALAADTTQDDIPLDTAGDAHDAGSYGAATRKLPRCRSACVPRGRSR